MKRKRGFTLIEVIMCISLIAIIGTVSIVSLTKVTNNNKLNKAYKIFDNALDVYLESHSDIYTNLKDNAEGAIISFELLKNEGLVPDNVKNPITNKTVDYKNNYYVLSDAVVTDSSEEDSSSCEGRVELKILKSWKELSKNGLSDTAVLYICPKNNNSTDTKESQDKITKLESKIDKLEQALVLSDLGSKNWVVFDVNSTKGTGKASFSKDESIADLWQIVTSSSNKVKIIYNTYAISNNTKKVVNNAGEKVKKTKKINISVYDISGNKRIGTINDTVDFIEFENAGFNHIDSGFNWNTNLDLIKYKNEYYIKYADSDYRLYYYGSNFMRDLYYKSSTNGKYVKYDNNEKWTTYEVFKEKYNTEGSKKNDLYSQINDNLKNYIEKNEEYNYAYTSSDGIIVDSTPINAIKFEDVFGTINPQVDGLNNADVLKSYMGKNFLIGYYSKSNISDDYYGAVMLDNGTVTSSSTRCDISCNESSTNNVYKKGFNEGFCVDSYRPFRSGYDSANLQFTTTSGPGYIYFTYNYVPVITLNNAAIVTNFNNYGTKYKDKYKGCTEEKLGTKECPRLLKFGNEYYSDGTEVE